MVTSLNTSRPARDANEQQVHVCRMEVNYNDNGIATGIAKAALPANAIIIGTDVHNQTSFNANSTNVLTVGSNSTQYDNVVGSGDVAEQTQGLTKDISPTGTALGPLSADTTFYAKYTQTGGTVATQGKAQIMIKYIVAEPGN